MPQTLTSLCGTLTHAAVYTAVQPSYFFINFQSHIYIPKTSRHLQLRNPFMPVNFSNQPFLSPKRPLCHTSTPTPNITLRYTRMAAFPTQIPKKLLLLLTHRSQGIPSPQDSKNLPILLNLSSKPFPVLTLQKHIMRKHQPLLHMPAALISPHPIISKTERILYSRPRQVPHTGTHNILFPAIRAIQYIPDTNASFHPKQKNHFPCLKPNFS